MSKSSTIAVIKDNKLLLLLRGSTAPYNPDKYGFPGGMVDENETMEECAVRELFEETGLKINVSDLIPMSVKYPSGYNKKFFIYNNPNIDQNINISWEHSKYGWFSLRETELIELVPNLNITIKDLANKGLLM